MNRSSLRSRGFTLVEMLVVVTIICILMGLLMPALTKVIDVHKRASAKNSALTVVTGVRQYFVDYGKWPINRVEPVVLANASADVQFPEVCRTEDLLAVLTTSGQGWDARSPNLNPRRTQYVEFKPVRNPAKPVDGIANGKLYDPWGNEFHIVIDYNNDGKVDLPYVDLPEGSTIAQSCVVYCYGKDGRVGSAGDARLAGSDDVVSWR